MAKNKNDMNTLIKNAIEASIDFEVLMDSIDFNSYLLEDQEVHSVKESSRYQTYKNMIEKASECCEDIIKKIPNKIKDSTVPPNSNDEDNLVQYLIYQLFEAKKNRLEGRQQVKWQEEKRKYIDCTHRLHKAFDSIPKEKFYDIQKDHGLVDNYNWAKVLYYNEMAICYSGLTESSMSLGYSERSISLLKEIYPKIDSLEGVSDQDIKLYTFAIYNKGEAERLLGNDELALKTFKKIVDIYEDKKLTALSKKNDI